MSMQRELPLGPKVPASMIPFCDRCKRHAGMVYSFAAPRENLCNRCAPYGVRAAR